MSYKSILVHGGADAAGEARLKAAVSVGALFGAALTVAGAEAWLPFTGISESTLYSPELIQAQRDALDKRLDEAKASYERICAGYAHPHLWRAAVEYPDTYISELARGADLIVAGRPGKAGSEAAGADPAHLIMQSGVPVLVVPPGADQVACGSIVIAWKDSREARRALSDSLPLLQRAEKVVLLRVVREEERPIDPQHDVLERLRRHGVKVTPDFQIASPEGEGQDIIQAAGAHHADIIVAGAYGHSRLREWAIGGVTRALIEGAPVPVLFAR